MTKMYAVRNWSQFQHYKDRNPQWIKMHFALLASEDWVMLNDASRLLAVVCMLIASRHNGCVPNNPAYIKRIAYLDQEPDLSALISCGFLSETLASASAVQAVDTECLSREEEIREEKSREERGVAKATNQEHAFVGRIVRLNISDFDQWRKNYSHITDLTAELTKADAYYADHPPADGKWFFPVSSWLKRENDKLAKAAAPADWRDDPLYRGVL